MVLKMSFLLTMLFSSAFLGAMGSSSNEGDDFLGVYPTPASAQIPQPYSIVDTIAGSYVGKVQRYLLAIETKKTKAELVIRRNGDQVEISTSGDYFLGKTVNTLGVEKIERAFSQSRSGETIIMEKKITKPLYFCASSTELWRYEFKFTGKALTGFSLQISSDSFANRPTTYLEFQSLEKVN